MACKVDVKQAILNKVMEELVEGRYTFTRISPDTIIVNNRADNSKTKASSASQAKAIGNNMAKTAYKSFSGHVRGEVYQNSPYDPVMVRFDVNPLYVDHVYNRMPASQQTDSSTLLDRDRNHINESSGPNASGQMVLFDVAEETTVGAFTKYVEFKKQQLSDYQKKLSKIQAAKKRKEVTTEELTKLNNQEKELKLLINGADELGIKGLKEEISDLMQNAEINAIGHYAEKDLKRLERLINSTDIDDIKEAQRIINFYTLAGTFDKNGSNPFFTEEELFLENEDGSLSEELKIDPALVTKLREWRNIVEIKQNTLDARYKEVAVNTVNSDPSIVKTYGGKKFSFEELTSKEGGLGDTDWVSMWTMDITQGIFSHNGVMPQVMFSYLANSFEKRLAWAREIEEKIDKMNPGVIKELTKLNHTLRSKGIVGLKGASYQLFKEITKEGNETGGLVQRFVKEFFDAQSKVLNDFSREFNDARLYEGFTERKAAENKAFNNLRKWRRENTVIMDITRLPEFSENTDNSYKDYLIGILGQRGYDEQVARQKELLKKYEADRQSMIETAMVQEGVDSYDGLSEKAKSNVSYWESNHSPFKGVEDYNSVNGIYFGEVKGNNFGDYNNFIPRRKKVKVGIDANTNHYTFEDTDQDTGHYSQAYSVIEENKVLREFYDVIKEVVETIREEMPHDLQQKLAVNSIPALQKTSAEMIADKNIGILRGIFPAFKNLMEKIRLSFGVTKQSEISYATIDPITGKPNYKVNDQFLQGNRKALDQRLTIEQTKFLQALNLSRDEANKVKAIKRFSVFPLQSLNTESLVLLAQYLHLDIPLADIQARRLDAIQAITGDNVQIGKFIRDYSMHTVVQTQSFDLAKIGKYFSNMTMAYAARQEALPVLEIMKKHYEGIQKPETNNLGSGVFSAAKGQNLMAGLRVHANKQMDDWFERVALGNYDTKHVLPFGRKTKPSEAAKGTFKPNIFRDIYSDEEKQRIKEIDELLKNETDEKKIEKLNKMKAEMGKTRTATAFFDNFMSWIRMLRLGYNLSSATTNLMEGVSSNMILASLGDYFDAKELFYGYGVIKHSFLKNVTFGFAETPLAKKNRSLMDKFNVVMDSRNELQKSSMKTYADKLSWLSPYALNQRTEFINQSPIMIAMLRTEKITGKDGTVSSVWDAYDSNGHLKDNFKTEENVKNWEELSGESYLNFKQKLSKAIVLAHGNYDELRGMMIKSNSGGKALMIFKSWLPMQIYSRFAIAQDDIQSGVKGFKGRYRSYGKGTAALHTAVVAGSLFGPIGALVGYGAGFGVGAFFGTGSGVGMLQETILATSVLAKKMIGMPVNMLIGKQVINTGDKAFESWVGQGKFTAQDAKNMRANMADISLQLTWIALMLIVKSMLWDDDDDPKSDKRKIHNVVVNKLLGLSKQAAMYINPVEAWDSILTNNAVKLYLEEVGKFVTELQEWFEGDDVKASGSNAGVSGLATQAKKLVLPGLFKDGSPLPYDFKEGKFKLPSLGFESQTERVFEESPWHEQFKSEEKQDKEDNSKDRAERRLELREALDADDFEGEDYQERDKAKEKEIKRILDEEMPTPAQLKKMEMTRDEYNDQREEENDGEDEDFE